MFYPTIEERTLNVNAHPAGFLASSGCCAAAPGPIDRPEPQVAEQFNRLGVAEQFNRLGDELEILEKTVEELASRLVLVCRPEMLCNGPESKPEPALAPLAEGLRQRVHRAATARNRLRDILSRLEV